MRVITADIGNSNIVYGVFRDRQLEYLGRIETHRKWTVQSMYREFVNAFETEEIPIDQVDGSILSSVVPEMNQLLIYVMERITGKKPLVMSTELKSGIRTDRYDTSCLGADRIVDMAAAAALCGTPVAVYDLGTATTLSVVNEKGEFIGGMISAGVQLSLNALAEHTSQLPQLSAEEATELLGDDTVSNMISGAVAAQGIMIDSVIGHVATNLGVRDLNVVITGGLGKLVLPWIHRNVRYEANLLLRGLLEIYEQNSAA
jgi:type III pantothenate kinase